MNFIFQYRSCKSAEKPDNKAQEVYQFNLVYVFKAWMEYSFGKPAGEHDYANIKTLINLPCFFLSLSDRSAMVQNKLLKAENDQIQQIFTR